MNVEEKKHYLEGYKKAKEKYETLKSNFESVHSTSFLNVGNGNNGNKKPNKTIVDKINEIDRADIKRLCWSTNIGSFLIIKYHYPILIDKYFLLLSDEEIAKDNNMTVTELNRYINMRLKEMDMDKLVNDIEKELSIIEDIF